MKGYLQSNGEKMQVFVVLRYNGKVESLMIQHIHDLFGNIPIYLSTGTLTNFQLNNDGSISFSEQFEYDAFYHSLSPGDVMIWHLPESMEGIIYPLFLQNKIRLLTPLMEKKEESKKSYTFYYTGLSEITKFYTENQLIAGTYPKE
jgi:hypothetical protein